MPNVLRKYKCNPADIRNRIRTAMLDSTDWVQIGGAQASTTLSAQWGAYGSGVIAVTSSTNFLAGQKVILVTGSSTRMYTIKTVDSATQITVDLTGINNDVTWPAGTTIANTAGYLLKSTTTRGAQMVIDLFAGLDMNHALRVDVYRTHDGTTGVDRVSRILNWVATSYATATDPVHVVVSAGKEHVWIRLEGSRWGEATSTNYNGSIGGLFLGDLVPYFGTDTVPAVVLAAAVGDMASGGGNTGVCYVSRNAANNASWVGADMLSLSRPTGGASANQFSETAVSPTTLAMDGNHYLWPYVVVEHTAGLRGRVGQLLHVGSSSEQSVSPNPSSTGERYTVGGVVFESMVGTRNGVFPWGSSNGARGPVVAVPA